MHLIRRTARLAGWLYLPVVLIGPFVLLYVPGKLFVPGDASATASNILANQSLFRASTMLGIVSELFFIASVLALYRLLKDVRTATRRSHGSPHPNRCPAGDRWRGK